MYEGLTVPPENFLTNSLQDEFIAHYNQLEGRRDLRSTVHSGMRVKFNSSRKVAEINLVFNGLEEKAFRVARITQKLIIGRYFFMLYTTMTHDSGQVGSQLGADRQMSQSDSGCSCPTKTVIVKFNRYANVYFL